jgi:uncharacterized protein YndB with AHSA1/START domain
MTSDEIIRMAREQFHEHLAGPLYKAPPQRIWVGLTDEEIKALPSWWPSYEDAPALIALVRDVEAKLRLKNTK